MDFTVVTAAVFYGNTSSVLVTFLKKVQESLRFVLLLLFLFVLVFFLIFLKGLMTVLDYDWSFSLTKMGGLDSSEDVLVGSFKRGD